jgi:HSP20 family protein
MKSSLAQIRPSQLTSISDVFDALERDVFKKLNNTSLTKGFEDLAYPKINAIDNGVKLTIEAAVPGLSRDKINVSYQDGILSIHGENTNSKQEADSNYLCRELRKSSFVRKLSIDDKRYDTQQIDAVLSDGILTITVPVKTPTQVEITKIEVK